MKRKLMLLLACLFVGIGLVTAQTQKVTGVVISEEDGQPVIGASVLVKGTQIGAITGVDGDFTLPNVPSSAKTLLISYVGMQTQEVAVAPSLRVILKSDSEILDEVTVIAYGTAKKNSLTGSVATIKSSDMEKLPVTSFEKALQGLSPGLQIASVSGQPGSSTQVRIRGIGSMSASSTPLYVIDGVAIEAANLSEVANTSKYGTSANPLSNLNPNDIESITILKDASAASLYGSRAANGVILITTKQGKKGQAKVSFKAQMSSSKLPSGGYDLMNASEHYALYYGGFYNNNIAKGMSSEEASAAANKSTQSMYGRNPYNVANPLDASGDLTSGAQLMIDTDWLDEVFRTGMSQEYDISVNGGNEKSKYFISMGYMNQEGIVIGSDFERYSGRTNVSTEIKPWFSMGINSTFSLAKQNTPVGGGGGASPLTNGIFLPNAVPVYDLDENFQMQYDENGKPLYNFKNPIFQDMNVISFAQTDKYATNTYRVLVNPYVDFNFYGVHWKTSLSYDYINLDETQWYNAEHGNGKAAQGRLYKYAIWNNTFGLTSTLNYNFNIKEDHHFSVLAGYEIYNKEYKRTYAQGTKFPIGGLTELNVAATPQEVGSVTDKERMLSYFGRLNYDYQNKYFASFSIRSDGSSRFAPGHRYGTFWSVGLNWRISEENFMKDITWLDDLKLRASYGTSGNKTSDYLYGYQAFYEGGANYNGESGFRHSQLANPDLSWEKSKNFNVGLDFAVLNSRLHGSIDYYIKNSDELLLEKPLAGSTGLDIIMSNLGGMRNSGIEVDLHSLNIQAGDFNWGTDFNISFNKNEITSYPEEQEVVGTKVRTVGYSLYEFYMQEWAGVDKETGAPLWYKDVKDDKGNPTGERTTTSTYSTADKYKLGSALPNVFGGLNNTFTFKGLDLSFLFTYSFHSTSSRYLHDADFIKFKNINLGYTLPKKWTQKIQLETVRFFGSLENICVWNLDGSFKGYDVELGGVTGVLDGAGTVPLPRTILFGINVGF